MQQWPQPSLPQPSLRCSRDALSPYRQGVAHHPKLVWGVAVLYCATQRAMLRSALGGTSDPRSRRADLALWCCCPALALCQVHV